MSRKWFRFSLLLGWVVCPAGVVAFFVEKASLPPELRAYLDSGVNEPFTGRDFLVILLVLLLLAVAVVNTVGLYRFRPWARTLYLWSWPVGYAISLLPFWEPTVTPPVAHTLFTLGNALSGFVLALIFFSPVARFFERRPPKSEEVLKDGRPES
jgi:hypothetical protein